MTIRQSTVEKFARAFPNFQVTTENNLIDLECRDCHIHQQHPVHNLTRRIAKGYATKCTSLECKPINVNGDFTNLPGRNVQCNHCELEYHLEKDVRYFVCYCQLRIKQTEFALYRFLKAEGFGKMARESYWDRKLTNHKCDIVILEGASKIFIEVDDKSHNCAMAKHRDATFEDLFQEERSENEFLVRVNADSLSDPAYLENILTVLDNPEKPAITIM